MFDNTKFVDEPFEVKSEDVAIGVPTDTELLIVDALLEIVQLLVC